MFIIAIIMQKSSSSPDKIGTAPFAESQIKSTGSE